jgi:surface protein
MKLKKIIQVLAAVLLTIAVSIGVTLAFLKSEVSEENIMTIGEVHIQLLEYQRKNTDKVGEDAVVKQFENGKLLVPTVITDPSASEKFSYDVNYGSVGTSYVNWGSADNNIKADYKTPIWNPKNISNEMDKMVFVENTGDYDAYVRLYFAFEAGNYVRYERFREMVHLNLNNAKDADNKPIWTWEWLKEAENQITDINGTRYFIATATYNKPLAPDSVTEISLSQIALDSLATNNEAAGFGSEYSVLVKAQAIQADGFTDVGATAALNEGFGSDIPFKNMKKLTFTDLKKAIGDNLKTVTFGLTADYAEEVKGVEGVFTANLQTRYWMGNLITEADFTAYTYRVPTDNGLYDVYVLADNWKICAPADCTEFFNYKTSLTKVDATNLDVSATTKMARMFFECHNLKEVDVSNWDVSNVTEMQGMFKGCKSLETLDVSKWDVGNVTKMSAMFENCSALEKLDVSNWDVGNVTGMNHMFNSCGKINNLDVSNWDVSKVTTTEWMFNGCTSLTKLDCSNWNTSNITTIEFMFQSCSNLKELDLSGWDVSKVATMKGAFGACSSLESLSVATWKFVSTDSEGNIIGPSVTTTAKMFSGCNKLKSLDLSGWNVSLVSYMADMFNSCWALESLNVSTWNVSSVTNMDQMFRECTKLTDLDVSSWVGVSKVETMASMFHDCSAITTLDLSRWNVSKVTNMNQTFRGCGSLTTLDLLGWNVSNVKDMTQMFYGDSVLTTIYAGGDWNVDSVTSHNEMFKSCTSLPEFDSGKVDKTGAKLIDNGGYLTYKEPPADATP